MKICIIGAGAIGGLIGTHLAAAREAEVSALARGSTLAALREHGWRVRQGEMTTSAVARAESDALKLGVQDVVIVAVKGPALRDVAATMAPLLGAETVVVPAMNGVPWWFCQGLDGFPDRPLASVDPDGTIANCIPYRRVVGCVVHASAAVSAPGLVEHRMGRGLTIGEPAGGTSERVARLADLLARAGLDVTATSNVRREIWYKLWGNLTMNPVSALTGATTEQILADPLVRKLCTTAMTEAARVGEQIGCHLGEAPEDRHRITAGLGPFRTSMLQDVEAGRAIELDAIVGAVHEIAGRLEIDTPAIDALLGLTRLFGRVHGLYPTQH